MHASREFPLYVLEQIAVVAEISGTRLKVGEQAAMPRFYGLVLQRVHIDVEQRQHVAQLPRGGHPVSIGSRQHVGIMTPFILLCQGRFTGPFSPVF